MKLLLNDARDDDSFSELDDDRESDVDFEPPDDPSDVESDDTVGSVPSEESESENGEPSDQAIRNLGCEPAGRQLSTTLTIAIYYYYSARKLILSLPSHGG